MKRDRFAAEAPGPPRPVPMFVEPVDALAHGFREAQPPRDVGAARAAGQDQLLRDRVAIFQDIADRRGAAAERRRRCGFRKNEVERGGEAGADGLETLLERAVVGFVERANPRRVARAAEVLEEQGVVEIVALARGEAQRDADLAADVAATDAMAGGLAFGDIERIAERADQLGEAGLRRG